MGVPPLYRLEMGRKSSYLYDDKELEEAIKGKSPSSYNIQRFKVRGIFKFLACVGFRGPPFQA